MKDLLEKLFKDKKLSREEFNTLIIEYISKEKGIEPNVEELNLIYQAFMSGIFNIDTLINNIGNNSDKYGVRVNRLYSKEGELIKTFVTEISKD